jgi:Ni/Co efflux regulator RcnB
MSVFIKTLPAFGLMAMAVLAVPQAAQADDGRRDWLESRADRAENRYDRKTDHGAADRFEDRVDRAEDRGDAAGYDRYQAIDNRERRTWRRILQD